MKPNFRYFHSELIYFRWRFKVGLKINFLRFSRIGNFEKKFASTTFCMVSFHMYILFAYFLLNLAWNFRFKNVILATKNFSGVSFLFVHHFGPTPISTSFYTKTNKTIIKLMMLQKARLRCLIFEEYASRRLSKKFWLK